MASEAGILNSGKCADDGATVLALGSLLHRISCFMDSVIR